MQASPQGLVLLCDGLVGGAVLLPGGRGWVGGGLLDMTLSPAPSAGAAGFLLLVARAALFIKLWRR